MERVHREIARDAARAAGAHLCLLWRLDAGPTGQPATLLAAAGPSLAVRSVRTPLRAWLAAAALAPEAGPVAAGEVPRAVAPCDAALSALLPAGDPCTLWLRLEGPGAPALLQLVLPAAPRPVAVPGLDALGRLAGGHLASAGLQAAAARDRTALADLEQAKEALAGLQIAGTQLMIETDEGSILSTVVRELARLGYLGGVLLESPGGDPARRELRWRSVSLPAALLEAMERVLGRPIAGLTVDPAAAPLVRRALDEGRPVGSDRARLLGHDLLGATPSQLRQLGRLTGLLRVDLAPLRREGKTIGLLVVASPRLRPGDPDAVEAFALQTSIALEKARLVTALREERARLEAEVARRTRELTLAVAKLQETDRKKDNFLANVSHELRTPLVTVLGWADLLASGKLGELAPRQRQAAQVIGTSGRRLKGFIDELLDLSRHELTGDRLAPAAFEVGDLLSQAVVGLAPRFAERGVRVRARAAPRLPRLWADRDRVVQVLVNLLANAERHSPPGAAVRVAAARGRAGTVLVSVRDAGRGIPPEHLARIFDRLYQVRDDRAPRDSGGGLGLGLAIARSIVEAHGGTISVRSRPGHGAAFRFSLPSEEVLQARPAATPLPAPLPAAP